MPARTFGEAQTVEQDLGFSETVFGLGAGVFFIGYFLFEVPSNLLMHRLGARIWIARIMITWGILSGMFMFVETPTGFYILRFLLGLAEAGFYPGVILYLTYWYPAHRRAKIIALFMSAIPVAGMTDATPREEGGTRLGESYAGAVVRATHRGPYRELAETHRKIGAWLAAHGVERNGDAWEVYVSDPAQVADAERVTLVYYPVKPRGAPDPEQPVGRPLSHRP